MTGNNFGDMTQNNYHWDPERTGRGGRRTGEGSHPEPGQAQPDQGMHEPTHEPEEHRSSDTANADASMLSNTGRL
jgi:hypothetical protein